MHGIAANEIDSADSDQRFNLLQGASDSYQSREAGSGDPAGGKRIARPDSAGGTPTGAVWGAGPGYAYQAWQDRYYSGAYGLAANLDGPATPYDGSVPARFAAYDVASAAAPQSDTASYQNNRTTAVRPGVAATPPVHAASGPLPVAAFQELPATPSSNGISPSIDQGPPAWSSGNAPGNGSGVPALQTVCTVTATSPSLVAVSGTFSAAVVPAAVTAVTLTDVLYLQETGTSAPISVYDINQGQLGDCFLLSSIGEIALWHPSAIMNMIQVNANGTETVTLYLAANGSLPTFGTTAFEAITITVTNTFPSDAVNNGATQDVLNGEKEIWVQVLEKAVATLGGGYNSIANGGNPMIAMEELTGQTATSMSPSSVTVQNLQSEMAAGDLIVMDTPASGSLSYGLYNDHAYMFESVSGSGSTATVQLLNPWGFDEPSPIPLANLASDIVEVDIGKFANPQTITGTSGNDSITLSYDLTNGSVDLGAGNDSLTLANGNDSATVANTETIIGGTGNDVITLGAATSAASIDLGAGNDSLNLATFAYAATVANTETIIGGAPSDNVTLATALTTGMSVDLGGGSNKLTLANVANTGTVGNIATLIGGTGDDTISLSTPMVSGSVNLGAGNDSLALANGGNTVTVGNTETITGGTGNDAVTLSTAAGNASINLGAGGDRLTFGNFANSATVANTETITGGTGNDTITLGSTLTVATAIDLGAGVNELTLANASNSGTVKNIATLIGGSGNDTIALGTAANGASIDLGAGNDLLTFGNFTNSATVANTETIAGGPGNDTITLATALTTGMSVDLGAGANKLCLANAANAGSVSNVTSLLGGSGNDTITLGTALTAAMSVDLGGGANKLTLANVANTGSVSNVETLIGGSGNDTITLTAALTTGMSVDLGGGANKLTLAGAANTGSVGNIGTLIGGAGNDTIIFTTAIANGSVDLGAGNNIIGLANATNSATIADTGTIVGGSGNDTITLGTAAANASIDLGAGNDKLTFGNFTNAATVANAETIVGGTGNDTITLATALTAGMSVDLGAGANKLTLANGANTGTVSNVNTLIGGSGNDTMTLGNAVANGSVDLGAGNDSLTLANGTNKLSVTNTETVTGGSGNDTIVLTGSDASMVIGGGGLNFITGNSGAATFVFNQDSAGNLSTIENFSSANNDKIGLDTTGSATLSGNIYNLGGAALSATDLKSVSNVAARLATMMNNGGNGAFVYEQDTGALYYSASGGFANGGTEIGVITTNGTTPWTFDASKFIQV